MASGSNRQVGPYNFVSHLSGPNFALGASYDSIRSQAVAWCVVRFRHGRLGVLKEAEKDALDRPPALLERPCDSRGRPRLCVKIEDDVARAGEYEIARPDRLSDRARRQVAQSCIADVLAVH